MPYIDPDIRDELLGPDKRPPETPGELNYLLASTCDDFIGDEYSYMKLNDVIGVLECVKLEVYRRIVAPYEDNKLDYNGEVFVSSSR
jgi:hypothetical protein